MNPELLAGRLDALEIRLLEQSLLQMRLLARQEAEKLAQAELLRTPGMSPADYLKFHESAELHCFERISQAVQARADSAAAAFHHQRQEWERQQRQKN